MSRALSGELRFVKRKEGEEEKRILQQRWHKPGGYEWVDVPLVDEEEENRKKLHAT